MPKCWRCGNKVDKNRKTATITIKQGKEFLQKEVVLCPSCYRELISSIKNKKKTYSYYVLREDSIELLDKNGKLKGRLSLDELIQNAGWKRG